MSIAFYEKEREEQERIAFSNFIKGEGVKYVHTNPDNELSNFNILFIHEPDFNNLKPDDTRGNQTIKEIYSEKWIILFGGNPSDFKQGNNEVKVLQYINYNDIKDRFEEIRKNIKALTIITKERLEEIIFGFDPELEKRLEAFAAINPLGGTDLKAEKAKLQERVNELLNKA